MIATGRWAGLAARITFSILVILLPFRARIDPLPHPAGAVPAVLADLVIYAIDVVAVAVLGLWLVSRLAAPDARRLELGPGAVRLAATVLVGLAWATVPVGIEPAVSVAGAVRLTLGVLLALYVVNEVDGLGSIAVPLGAMLAIQSIVGLAQAALGGSVGLGAIGELRLDPGVSGTSVVGLADGSRILRAYGLSTHPNVLGGILACGALLLAGARPASRAGRLGWASILALATMAVVATFSRGAWLGAGAGVVVGALVLAASGAGRAARTWLAGAAILGFLALAIGWVGRDAVASRAGLGPSVPTTEARSIEERLAGIRLGWRVLLDRPLTGAGASAVPLAMRELEPDYPYPFYAPHLVPLAVAGELGVGGGLAYLALMAAPWALLVRDRGRFRSARRPDGTAILELAAASAALAALQIVSMFDDYPWIGGPGRTLGWLVIGLWVLAWVRAGRRVGVPRAGAR